MSEEDVNILCVDDEPNVLSSLRRLFIDNDNYTILTANSGEEALKIVSEEDLQLIISDYRMPVMNGVEFLRQAYKIQPDTVRIVLSGYADVSAIVSAINDGQIYKFIPKPWNDDELKVTVANAIERYFLFKRNMEMTKELNRKNNELTLLNSRLEKLLAEKSANLEFRSEVLAIHQNILDSIPVGIVGVDVDGTIVLANTRWNELTQNSECLIGMPVENSFIKPFFEAIQNSPEVKKRTVFPCEIKGVSGRFVASNYLSPTNKRQGVILVFISDNIIS